MLGEKLFKLSAYKKFMKNKFLKITGVLAFLAMSPTTQNSFNFHDDYKHPIVIQMEREYELKKYNSLIRDLKFDIEMDSAEQKFLKARCDSVNYPDDIRKRYGERLKKRNYELTKFNRELRNLYHKRDSVGRLLREI